MTLYARPHCIHSHRVRLVLQEKGIGTIESVDVKEGELHEDLAELNPYGVLPTFVDRDLVLYDAAIIMEYLDERFPHPPLMPVDPVSRARMRLALYRIDRDLYSHVDDLENGPPAKARKARKAISDNLTSGAEVFSMKPFFLSDEFSLVDCTLAPLLWRLQSYKIELPKAAAPVEAYAQRLFKRPGFRRSLTEAESELRG